MQPLDIALWVSFVLLFIGSILIAVILLEDTGPPAAPFVPSGDDGPPTIELNLSTQSQTFGLTFLESSLRSGLALSSSNVTIPTELVPILPMATKTNVLYNLATPVRQRHRPCCTT